MKRAKTSLRARLTLITTAVLGAMLLTLLALTARLLEQYSLKATERRSVSVSHVLASALRPALDFDDPAEARRLIALSAGPDVQYGEVRRADGSLLAAWRPDADESLADPRVLTLPPSKSEHILVEGEIMHVLVPIETVGEDGKKKLLGTLRLDGSLRELSTERQETLGLIVMVGLLLVLLGAVISSVLGSYLVRPIQTLTRVTRTMAAGDLRADVPDMQGEAREVAELAASFSAMVEVQRALLGSMRHSVEELAQAAARIEGAGSIVARSARSIENRVEDATTSMQRSLETIEEVGDVVDALQRSTHHASEVMAEMAKTQRDAANNIASALEGAAQSTAAIEALVASSSKIAQNISELDNAARETTLAMEQIGRSISDVQRHARDSAELSDQASQDAELGRRALHALLESLTRVRSNAEDTRSAMSQLGQGMTGISGVVEVIQDFAKKTNLLALNAGILASNAGEHGRAFNVVADEIKSLADRTRASTLEISETMARLRKDSDGASRRIEDGLRRSTQESSAVADQAEAALQQILASSKQSASMVAAIAKATSDEVNESRRVNEAFQRVGRSLQQINQATRQQVEDGALVKTATADISRRTQELRRASQEQADASKVALAAMDDVQHAARKVHIAQESQTRSTEQIRAAVETIRAACGQQDESVRNLELVLEDLRRQAREAQDVVQRFKV